MVAEIVGVRAVGYDVDAASARCRYHVRPELGLAEVTAVRRIRRVPRILQLGGVDLDNVEPDDARRFSSRDPLALGIRCASPRDGENVFGAQRVDGDGGEI